MYGLDADLIMLSLMSHERAFSLLREELHFEKGELTEWDATWKRVEKHNLYNLLHIGILREYLDMEFSPLIDNVLVQSGDVSNKGRGKRDRKGTADRKGGSGSRNK